MVIRRDACFPEGWRAEASRREEEMERWTKVLEEALKDGKDQLL